MPKNMRNIIGNKMELHERNDAGFYKTFAFYPIGVNTALQMILYEIHKMWAKAIKVLGEHNRRRRSQDETVVVALVGEQG